MSRFQTLVALNVAFIAGCVASQLALVVPPVRAGTNPQRWEHNCRAVVVGFDAEKDVNKAISEMGSAGWELVTNAGVWFCFKRPL